MLLAAAHEREADSFNRAAAVDPDSADRVAVARLDGGDGVLRPAVGRPELLALGGQPDGAEVGDDGSVGNSAQPDLEADEQRAVLTVFAVVDAREDAARRLGVRDPGFEGLRLRVLRERV